MSSSTITKPAGSIEHLIERPLRVTPELVAGLGVVGCDEQIIAKVWMAPQGEGKPVYERTGRVSFRLSGGGKGHHNFFDLMPVDSDTLQPDREQPPCVYPIGVSEQPTVHGQGENRVVVIKDSQPFMTILGVAPRL